MRPRQPRRCVVPGARGRSRTTRVAGAVVAVLALTITALVATPAAGSAVPAASAPSGQLYLVTLAGPGTSGLAPGADDSAATMRAQQDLVLATVDAPEPVYRWTTALNGVAVTLDTDQAARIGGDPRVVRVERDDVRRLQASGTTASRASGAASATLPGAVRSGPASGGRGVVVGLVDSGLDPASPSFASLPSLGPAPARAGEGCAVSEDWPQSFCDGKVVAARWFVDGFGADAVRNGASISPLDDDGHGTLLATVVAGAADIAARVRGQRVATVGGQAPDARLAVYKACWTAPDPDGDGCSSADLVTAVDRAVGDGVDVLTVPVAGPDDVDTLDRALLGAAEADVVVVGAAGNDARSSYAAHPVPWVTTVGAAGGVQPRGAVAVQDGPALTGASASRTTVGPVGVVAAEQARRASASAARARVCAPGTLDASLVAGRVVLCRRGAVGRIDKSATVALADGAGMVLLNARPGSTYADFHSVPTVHLAAPAGRRLEAWLREHPDARVTLRPDGARRTPGVPPWSAPGDPVGVLVKPDLVAPATGLVGAVPEAVRGARWDVASGTSAATAWTAGAVAALRSRHRDWSAAEVRSALVTGAARVPGTAVLRAGAGRARPAGADGVRLSYPQTTSDYRAWLEGDRRRVNTPSVELSQGRTRAVRTIRNTARRSLYFSSSTRGLSGAVQVRPAAVRLAPGESARFVVRAPDAGSRAEVDDGYVLWRGGDGSRSRIPVVVAR